MSLARKLPLYARLVRIDKPIGTLLLLWPTLWALWIAADGMPPWPVLAIFVAGTFLMRSAGCAINDYADRDFDRHVARTKARVVTSGAVSPREALIVAAVLALAAGALILPLNRLTWALAVVAVVLAATYPYFKRFFAIPQAYLGIAFSFGIPMAFAAVRNEVPPLAWGLLGANLFWVLAYDTAYALADIADDLKLGIKTSAITFGKYAVVIVMACYAVFLLALLAVGTSIGLGLWFRAGLAVAAVIAGYHYTLIRHRDPARCFRAFVHNHWLGAAVFAGVALDHALR